MKLYVLIQRASDVHMYLVLNYQTPPPGMIVRPFSHFVNFLLRKKLESDLIQNHDSRAAGGPVTAASATPTPDCQWLFRHFGDLKDGAKRRRRAVNPSKNTHFNRLKTESGRAAMAPLDTELRCDSAANPPRPPACDAPYLYCYYFATTPQAVAERPATAGILMNPPKPPTLLVAYFGTKDLITYCESQALD